MYRAAAFVLILATVLLLQRAVDRAAGGATVGLALGFALVAASLIGRFAEQIRLPRLSGYLLFGLLCGPYMLDVITAPMARDLQTLNGLAIALIAFIAGLEINLSRLRPRLRAIAIVSVTTMAVMYVLLATALLVGWRWLPLAADATGVERLAIVLVFTCIVVSFSPTVSIAVIAETRARGPLSELLLAVVVLADVILILMFALAMQFARSVTGGAPSEVPLQVHLAWEIGGSVAFGALLGALFAIYLRSIGRELTLVLLGLCAAMSLVGPLLHLEPLLIGVSAGLVAENVAPRYGDALREAVQRGATPVLVIFFAAAGASLHLDALAALGLTAAAVASVRLGAIRAGSELAIRLAGVTDQSGRLMWMGLISQAGVTLGLTILLAREFPDWGGQLQTLVVAMIALHELVGPILFRAALIRAGEAERIPAPQP